MAPNAQLALDWIGGGPQHPEPHERVLRRLRLQVCKAGLACRKRGHGRQQRLRVNASNSAEVAASKQPPRSSKSQGAI